MKNILIKSFLTLIVTALISTSAPVFAFEKAVWIPYWRKTDGASSTLQNIKSVTQISPFAYELQNDGTITNALKIESAPWPDLIKEAKKNKVKIYPSILSYPNNETGKKAVLTLLSDKKKRQAHVKEIAALVKKNNFDGIDIDYEAKLAETKPYFASFLSELSTALKKDKKKLICTIEPRTPPDSRYATTSKEVLSKVEYANDYKAIGKACDEVRIMAYDQSTDDAKLVNQNKLQGKLYAPVADIEWVKKVVTVALWDIPAKKILIGVPTYGYKYEVIRGTSTIQYRRIGTMNYEFAEELAQSLKITPTRNSAGELSFSYSSNTDRAYPNDTKLREYLVWYSDAEAIKDKVKLAKLYKLGGVSVFRVDGSHDPRLFEVLK